MNLRDSPEVVLALRERLEPVERARILTDVIEGIHPHARKAAVLLIMPPVFTVVSNFLITPVVAYLAQGPGTLQLQPSEVDELILLPLQGLADPAILHTEEWERGGLRH